MGNANNIMRSNPVEDTKTAFASVMSRTNRIISGKPVRVRYDILPGYPYTAGWSTDQDVYINDGLMTQELAKAIADKAMGDSSTWDLLMMAKLGLNYHELSHLLYSPGSFTPLRTQLRAKPAKWQRAWNILEDQRIEMIFWTTYLPAEPYFTYMVMKWVLGSSANETDASIGGAFPYVVQRMYLPAKFRAKVRASFIKASDEYIGMHGAPFGMDKYSLTTGTELADEIEGCVRDFILNKSKSTAAAMKIIGKFVDLLNLSDSLTDSQDRESFDSHEQQRGGEPTNEAPTEDVEGMMGEVDEEDAESGEFDGDSNDTEEEEEAESKGKGKSDAEEDAEAGKGGDGEGDEDDDDTDGDADTPTDGKSTAQGDTDGKEIERDGDVDGDSAPTSGAGNTYQNSSTKTKPEFKGEIEKIIDDLRQDEQVKEELEATNDSIADALEEPHQVTLPRITYGDQKVPGEARGAVNKMIEELADLRSGLEEHWVHEERSGRINVRQAMKRKVVVGPFDMFDDWEPSTEAAGGVEAVILDDKSGSMGNLAAPACLAIWQIKTMMDSFKMPCTVMGYGENSKVLFDADERAESSTYRFIGSPDGSTLISDALAQAGHVFDRSKEPNRILFVITDGHWQDASAADSIIRSMNAHGVITVLVHLEAKSARTHQRTPPSHHGVQVFRTLTQPGDLVPIMRELVTMITRNAMADR